MNSSSSAPPAAAGPAPRLLDKIRGPTDVKVLPADQLPRLAAELREEMIAVTSLNGGHVAPNLGVVELTIALHRVFNTPEDQFVFDVSHQGYAHKLLTGRKGEAFRRLRQSGGVSGFLCRAESPHDCYGAGHAGTALSAALGMATARDLRGSHEHVVAICGDAAFTCGITMEALNNVVACTRAPDRHPQRQRVVHRPQRRGHGEVPQPPQHQPHLQQDPPRPGEILHRAPARARKCTTSG